MTKKDFTFVTFHYEGVACARCMDGKWCHVNENYEPLYEERYDMVRDFNDGLAAVMLDGDWFHISKDGNPAYEKRYDWAGDFRNGVAKVRQWNESFYIDKKGSKNEIKIKKQRKRKQSLTNIILDFLLAIIKHIRTGAQK